MRLIIVGPEYAGKTTLAENIVAWRNEVMGPATPLGIVSYHDHFMLPWVGHWDEIPEEALKKFMDLGPELKEMVSRYQFSYHLEKQLYDDSDHILIGFHIEEAVYAPLYYGYGKAGEYGDRQGMVRSLERHIMEMAPDTILVYLKCSPDAIRPRLTDTPHERGYLRDEDVDHVVERTEFFTKYSMLRYRITIDTSESTPEQTMKEFVDQVGPLLNDRDRLRIQAHSILSDS